MPRVQILVQPSQAGLSRNVAVVRATLEAAGYVVSVRYVRSQRPGLRKVVDRGWPILAARVKGALRRRPLYDINIFLEHVWAGWLPAARFNCLFPNPEWLREGARPWLPALDLVLCKTRSSQAIFAALGCRTEFTSFTSVERYDPTVPRAQRAPLHVAGNNSQKGSEALLRIWQRHPEWPLLKVVNAPARFCALQAENVQHISRLPDAELQRLQNAHDIHLCPSEVEGWGHSIVEGMTVGAALLTTDAPPMNELVTPERGTLFGFGEQIAWRLGTIYKPDLADLEAKTAALLEMEAFARQRLGANARQWYLDNDAFFRRRLVEALEALSS